MHKEQLGKNIFAIIKKETNTTKYFQIKHKTKIKISIIVENNTVLYTKLRFKKYLKFYIAWIMFHKELNIKHIGHIRLNNEQLNLIKEKDSVYHTDDESLQKKYSGEIALFSPHIFENDEQKKIFIKFIKQNFNFDYKEPENETEVILLVKMLIIYNFNNFFNCKILVNCSWDWGPWVFHIATEYLVYVLTSINYF